MRAYLDANFFISGFSDRPKDVYAVKEAADIVGIELWITRQVFHELRWYLRREVENIINIDETLKKDIKEFMQSLHRPESSLPQPNDMSLVLAAMRAKNSKIVSSDLKLLNTIQDLKVEVEGIVGSAFMLELIESVDDEKIKEKLRPIRDRIYAEEVRYSIARRESYDPVTRIRIIEEHALRVLRTVKQSTTYDKKLQRGQSLFVLDFLDDIKASIPGMFEDFKAGKYETLAQEIEAVQNEIERLLIVSTLTEAPDTHRALVEHAADLTLFLYYFEMMCHLYRGTREGVHDAVQISEEANRLLMFATVKDDELKASVFFLRIILGLVRHDYDDIDYFFSLYEGMLDRAGLDHMKETSEGLYVTMQILRKFMGGFSVAKARLKYPGVTIDMLNDLAKYYVQFDEQDSAWQLSANAYKIGVAYGNEEGTLQSFLMLYKISSSVGDRYHQNLERIAEHALKIFVKKGWNTSQITPILNEIQGNPDPIPDMTTESAVAASKLPAELRGWMDVLSIQTINGEKILVVRNNELQARVGLSVAYHPELTTLKTGHKIALVTGKYRLENAPDSVISKYRVMLLVYPEKRAEITCEGEYGFSRMHVSRPEDE
ncbi:MAG: hypothetical protein K9W43_10595 [Candidatus Thorarchaeota archaeon]|nr:hypothetical protein [Candidatus Thorarchaeota archaeon]